MRELARRENELHSYAEAADHVACAFADGSAIGFSASGREGASEYPAASGVHTPGADGSPH